MLASSCIEIPNGDEMSIFRYQYKIKIWYVFIVIVNEYKG
jgi:hypothetical protein